LKNNNFIPLILLVLLGFVSCKEAGTKSTGLKIIPVPEKVVTGDGDFYIKQGIKVMIDVQDNKARRIASKIVIDFTRIRGWRMGIEPFQPGASNVIMLQQEKGLEEELGREGYHMQVTDTGVYIKAAGSAGLFYGVQTLYQMLPPDIFGAVKVDEMVEWRIPVVNITDKPCFQWRGMHLDVSRHFFPVEFIKRYIDLIAMHKMNVFHWHLTDDNGWRMEIMRYPRLMEHSAWRVDREDQPWRERTPPEPGERATYGGYYTQLEIEKIIRYAEERYVTIIPEIEMPGHTSEVFAAYPELSCRGDTLYVQPGSYWPNVDIFCAGKEETFEFIENVLLEAATIFPSEYIHIGGDEADKTRWKECRFCRERMENENLESYEELQSYFIKRVEKYLKTQDKKLIGWDEILEGGLAPEAAVMSWRGFEGGKEAAEMGHEVIMCPTSHCYFDYYQDDPETQPVAIGGLTPLEKVYAFNPIPPELPEDKHRFILGGQGNLWTEFVPTPEHATYMVLPRMTALAEVLWSPSEHRDFEEFKERLTDQFVRFDVMGVMYYPGGK